MISNLQLLSSIFAVNIKLKFIWLININID